MRHPLRWLLVAIVIVVLGVAGAVAWYVFGDSAPAKPKLTDRTVVPGAATSPNGQWKVAKAKGAFVGYRIKELFGGATIKRDAVGRTQDATGTMTIAGNEVRAVNVVATLTDLESDRAARDSYIHDHALEVDKFTTARFVLAAPLRLTTVVPGTEVHESAVGDLTLHGVTKRVTMTLDASWDGKTIEVAGTAPITLADYSIERPKTPIVSVDDHGSLEVHLFFARAG
jgi:polyisoprenoid-binding protein YceI